MTHASWGSRRLDSARGRWVGFALLAATTLTILTNSYFLRFAEPAVPRSRLALGLFAITGTWFLLRHFGIPRGGSEWAAIARRVRVPALLAGIAILGFTLRLEGASSGLPQSYVPDEYEYVHSYLQMIKRGDLNPRWWHHPSVQPYVNVATFLTVFFLQARTGRWESVQQVQVEDMLYWGRLGAGVIPGTLVILFVFLLARRLFDDSRMGLVAAAILAVAPGLVEISQYNKPDALLVLFSTVTVLVIGMYLDRGGRFLALAAGAAVGFTVAVKYNSALLLIPFVVAVVFRRGLGSLTNADLYLGGLGSILGFVVGCPYFYADLPRFIDHVGAGLFNYGFAGLAGAEGLNNWLHHASYTVRYGTGWWVFVSGLAGLAVCLFRIDRRLTVFLAYPILYYGFYSSQRINFPGNLMPVYPFLAILAAYGLVAGADLLSKLLTNRKAAGISLKALPSVATILGLGLLLWFPANMTLRRNRLITLPDTGAIAGIWIDANLPPGTHLLAERHTPVLDKARYTVDEEKHVINKRLPYLREAGVEYLVAASTNYERFGPEHRQTRRYARLFEQCPLVKEFSPEPDRVMGPTIRILAVPPLESSTQPELVPR